MGGRAPYRLFVPNEDTPLVHRQSALLRLATGIAAAHDEAEICRSVVKGLHDDALGYDFVGFLLVDRDTGDRVLRAAVGWEGAQEGLRIPPGAGLSERPLLDGGMHYSPAVRRESHHVTAAASGSELDLPVLVDNEVVGVLVVESEQENAFGQADFEILTAAAQQAGIAIGRARLLQAERRRADEQKAVLDTLGDLSRELELPRLLQALLERAVRLLGVTGGELAIYQEEKEELVVVASHNIGGDSTGTRMKLGEGAMGRVAVTQEPLIIANYQEWDGRSTQYDTTTARGVIVAPLLIGSRLVGTIAIVHTEADREFGPEDLRLLNLFGPQAAIAIENAHLFTAEHRRAEEQKALLDTLADLSAELELEKLLQAVVERAVTLLGVTGGELAIYDEERQELVVVASHHIGGDSTGTRMMLGEGAMGRVAATHEPLIIPNYQEWEGRSAKYTKTTARGVMVVPLLIGQRLVGALASVHTQADRQFGPEDLRLLNLFAPQAAIAIENARLFTDAQRQKRYFETVVQNSPVAIVTLDLGGSVVSLNPAFERLFGYTPEEARGRMLDELINTETTLLEAVGYTHQAAAGLMAHGIGKRRRKDGSVLDVELAGVPVEVEGERVGILALYHDVTELLRARRAAEEASKAKSQFLANMSHELRTPLNAIIGYSEMLAEEVEELGQLELVPDLQKIRTAGRHLLGLINDILDLSKIEAGKMDVYLETIPVSPMIEEVAATVKVLAERNENRLELRTAGELGTIRSDPTKVRQMLLNLLSNACKFTESGVVTMEAERSSVPGDGDWITFRVRDSGIGMTPEQLDRLFQAFTQAETSTTRRFGGTGLGLAITRHFCQLLGGSVQVESEEGAGSTFTLRLPAEAPHPGPPAAPETEAEQGSGEAGVVLIVDDDEPTRHLMRKILSRDGFYVLEAADGEEGLRVAREHRPDVITLDVMMPGVDGWTVLRLLKEDAVLAAVPVVIVTVVDDRRIAEALGAAEYLTKPLDRQKLRSVLARYRRPSERNDEEVPLPKG